ncbi:DUF805 domain-containing protein [Staphylococcus debuckii]|uniref:DUF805 domain-containing protein n=1 Tax=Staphylococcus debuckii TaxID=2044912 RepID=A0ABU9F0K1_9STAP
MYCNKCGAKLNSNDAFCARCGAPIASNKQTATSSASSELNIWQNYQAFWRNFINFKGYTKRTPFWVSTIINILITTLLMILGITGRDELTGQASPILYVAIFFIIATLCPQLAITYRRFNDVKKRKWSIWVSLILPIEPFFEVSSGAGNPIASLLLLVTIGLFIYNFTILISPSKERAQQ